MYIHREGTVLPVRNKFTNSFYQAYKYEVACLQQVNITNCLDL